MKPPSKPSDRLIDDRSSRIQLIVDAFRARKGGGEAMSEDEIIAAHPELLPELRIELHNWDIVDQARLRARSSSGHSPDCMNVGHVADAGNELHDIQGYELIEEIHRGGQGVVYLAFQRSTNRKVAIKIMRAGPFASASDRARFDREVQILGQLNHPNIVTVHDSGSAGGSFYFVMDYVPGLPINEYVRPAAGQTTSGPRSTASIADVLRLFAEVCGAVNSAHLLGIVHRDLKPANILVDARGEPHILDFGFARRTSDVQDATVMTITGQFIGSVPWSSPEQAAGTACDVDIRTDVYSLGVLLYQLLTGRFPYEVMGNLREVMDRIMTAEPICPRTLDKRIDDEVETIVLKCLSKERGRRYQSAGELSRDIHRYLDGEAIEAKRESQWYVLRKHFCRHRWAVGVTAGFILVITAGLITSLALWRQASNLLDRAVLAEQEQSRQRAAAQDARDEAKREAAKAEAVNVFLQTTLGAARLGAAKDHEPTIREAMEDAARLVGDGELRKQPEVEAAVRYQLGMCFLSHGLLEPAEAQLRSAVELCRRQYARDHDDVAITLNGLARVLEEKGDFAGAEPLCREALDMRRRLHGEHHSETAESLLNLGTLLQAMDRFDEAERFQREALAAFRATLGHEDIHVAVSLNNLGMLLRQAGKYQDAEPPLKDALALTRKLRGEDHIDVAIAMDNLATLFDEKGDFTAAEPLYRDALAMKNRVLGDEHPGSAVTMQNLGELLRKTGRIVDAETELRRALAILSNKLGEEHPDTVSAVCKLARVLQARKEYADAETQYRRALAIRRRIYGGEHSSVAESLSDLAAMYRDMGNLDEAEQYYRQTLDVDRNALGNEHPFVAADLNNLGEVLREKGELVEAGQFLSEALSIRRKSLPPDHLDLAATLVPLGDVFVKLGKAAEAEPLLQEGLEIRIKALPPDHWRVAIARGALGACLTSQRKFSEAEPLLLASAESLLQEPTTPDHVRRDAIDRLIHFYESTGDPEAAEHWRQRLGEVSARSKAAEQDAEPD